MAHPVRHRPGTSCRREAGPRDRFVGTGAYPGSVTEEGAAGDGSRERFEDLVDQLVGTEGVTPPRAGSGFGRSALRFRGKIFAMHVRGALVLKLPAERVERWSGPVRASTSTRTRGRRCGCG